VGEIAGSTEKGYRRVDVDGKTLRAHRVIWAIVTGAWPTGQIDHEDRNRSNNRWSNLSDVTDLQNRRNRSRQVNNTSGVTGVTYLKRDQKWRARIKVGGRYRALGEFPTLEQAAAARKTAMAALGFSATHGQ